MKIWQSYSTGFHRNDWIPAGITGASQRPPSLTTRQHIVNFKSFGIEILFIHCHILPPE
jgi:hypothetical protein